ncbi:MAG: LysM peptidoglycan-binding domain-containing protein, partial [Actinomycetales bacterium]|nr:LysM peptidoglycan-binding domain-containing protein [Actinomycetales bacterium]
GDSLWAIATRNGTTVEALMSTNRLGTTIIHPGQVLTLPGSASAPTPATPAPLPAPAPASASPSRTITVVAGDTLSGLAVTHGTTVSALMAANALTSTTIYVGQQLTLPGASAAPTPPSTQLVPSTFLHYTYPTATVSAANANKATLLAMDVPSRDQMRQIVRETATSMGVNPALALAIAMKESGFDQRAVSPANAIGTMQVIPSSGAWASTLVGRDLNLLDARDNVTAGVAIIRQLVRTSSSLDIAIASYYQGAGSVARYGMFSDTRSYVTSVKAYMAQFGG